MPTFIDCTSLNFSYDIMGLVSLTYTMVSDTSGFQFAEGDLSYGGRTFSGFVSDASFSPIPYTSWFETHVTVVAIAT